MRANHSSVRNSKGNVLKEEYSDRLERVDWIRIRARKSS